MPFQGLPPPQTHTHTLEQGKKRSILFRASDWVFPGNWFLVLPLGSCSLLSASAAFRPPLDSLSLSFFWHILWLSLSPSFPPACTHAQDSDSDSLCLWRNFSCEVCNIFLAPTRDVCVWLCLWRNPSFFSFFFARVEVKMCQGRSPATRPL